MKKSTKPTPREKIVFQAIVKCDRYNCEMPTYQEIADEVKRSRTTVFENVQNLIDKGYLSHQGFIRGLEFTGKVI